MGLLVVSQGGMQIGRQVGKSYLSSTKAWDGTNRDEMGCSAGRWVDHSRVASPIARSFVRACRVGTYVHGGYHLADCVGLGCVGPDVLALLLGAWER